ncbi:MAG: hypothetical protein V1918_05175 [Planctomycetota bacterium]
MPDVTAPERPPSKPSSSPGVMGSLLSLSGHVFSDLMQFIAVGLLGAPDRTQAFAASLRNAERYMYWGKERNDPRDYHAALHAALACRDEDAPKPDMLLRKYTVLLETLLSIMQHSLEGFHRKHDKTHAALQELKTEMDEAQKTVSRILEEAAKLEREGSVLKSQEAVGRAQSFEKRLKHVLKSVQDSNALDGLAKEHRKVSAEFFHRTTQLEVATTALQNLVAVPEGTRDRVIQDVRKRHTALKKELDELKSEPPAEQRPHGGPRETTVARAPRGAAPTPE